jgi:hypothetical protein
MEDWFAVSMDVTFHFGSFQGLFCRVHMPFLIEAIVYEYLFGSNGVR